MKIKKCFCPIVVLFLVFAYTQTYAQVKGEATYLVTYQVDFAIDSTNSAEISHEMHLLYTGNTVSRYGSRGLLVADSILKQMRKEFSKGNRQVAMHKMRNSFKNAPKTKFVAEVYKDLTQQQVWVEARIMRDQYKYKEPAIPLKWKFTGKTKKIGKYSVQEATVHFGGRQWTAWFSLQIPIHDGPYVFCGLPGLILELYDAHGDYHFEIASIKQLATPYAVNATEPRIKKVTKDQFIKAYKNNRANPLASLGRVVQLLKKSDRKFPNPRTGKMITGQELIHKIKETVRTRNNYIEKW